MEMVATLALTEGRIICEDVTSQGQVIVKKNTKVTQQTIQKLNMFKIVGVNCYEPADFAVSYYEKLRLSKPFAKYKETYATNLIAYKVAVDSFVYNRVPFRQIDLIAIADALCPENMTGKQLFAYINLLTPTEEELPYAHGLNTGLIARMFGRWLNFSKEDQIALTVAGFVYDVGKNILPSDIIWKPAKLNKMEMDLMKTHAFHAYHLLSKTNLEQRILNSVLQHHERCDGSGYPQGLVASEIDDFAKIIAIIDMYEAMTSPRTYRDPMCPYKAIAIFEQDFFQKYDVKYIQTFMNRISDELIGSRIKLNTGDEGEVIMTNKNTPSRPVIQMDDGALLDLSKLTQFFISEII